MSKINWERNANMVAKDFGSYVDWDERYYICPDCGEVVYEEDWADMDFEDFLCPICEYVV